MKRQLLARIAVATIAAAALGSLTACGGSSGGNGTTTLKLVAADYGTGPSNSSQKYWQAIADAFHKQNPKITVDVHTINWNDFDNQVQTQVQNHQFPDITEGDYFSNYASENLLYKASEVMSPATLNSLLPAFKNQGSYKGTQYGMPFTTSSRTLFYNKKIFQQAGITSAPTTWSDIQTDAGKIKALGKTGFGLPLGSEEAQAEALLWMLGNGGNYQDAQSHWTIDSQANVQTFQFLQQLVKSGDTEPNPGTKNRTDLWKQFAQGQIGMINGSPALIPIIEAGKVLNSGDWASVPVAGKNGPLTQTLGVCDNVAAFKSGGSGKQAAIKKFLDFAYQDTYQLQFAKEYALLPATTSAAATFGKSPEVSAFVKSLTNAVQYPVSQAWAQVKTQIQQTIGTAISGNPSSVLSAIQKTAEKGD